MHEGEELLRHYEMGIYRYLFVVKLGKIRNRVGVNE
jgi:hypothetical protein